MSPAQRAVAYVLADPGIPVGGVKGASAHVEALCCAMARTGTRVTLYAARVVGPLRTPGADGVRVVPLDAGPVPSGPAGETARIAAAQRFFDRLADALRADRPDWVHERLTLFAGQGGQVSASLGLARVVEVNAPVADERRRHLGLLRGQEASRAERAALHGARVLAVSDPLASWALANGAREVAVVPNGADPSRLDPGARAARRASVRAELGVEGRVVVGFTGSLKPWHGVELLVGAVGAVAAAAPLALLVVGDGPGRRDAERAAARLPASVKAVLTGAVPFADVPDYLGAMDIAAAPYLPSNEFYFSPLKVVEAMAAGLAVVASDFPPIRELLDTTGVLVPAGDAGSLTAALAALAADPGRRRRLGERARARAEAHFGWDAVAGRTMAFATAGREPLVGA